MPLVPAIVRMWHSSNLPKTWWGQTSSTVAVIPIKTNKTTYKSNAKSWIFQSIDMDMALDDLLFITTPQLWVLSFSSQSYSVFLYACLLILVPRLSNVHCNTFTTHTHTHITIQWNMCCECACTYGPNFKILYCDSPLISFHSLWISNMALVAIQLFSIVSHRRRVCVCIYGMAARVY